MRCALRCVLFATVLLGGCVSPKVGRCPSTTVAADPPPDFIRDMGEGLHARIDRITDLARQCEKMRQLTAGMHSGPATRTTERDVLVDAVVDLTRVECELEKAIHEMASELTTHGPQDERHPTSSSPSAR